MNETIENNYSVEEMNRDLYSGVSKDDVIKKAFKSLIDSTYLRHKRVNPKLKKKTIANQIVAMVKSKAFWDVKQEVKKEAYDKAVKELKDNA